MAEEQDPKPQFQKATSIFTIPFQLTLGQKARLLRIARGMRQFELAALADTSPSMVSALERDRKVYASARIRLIQVLGLEGES